MMFLNLKPTKIQMRSAFGDTDGREGSSLNVVVEMTGQDQLELKTGEFFENPRLSKIRGNASKAISATLSVLPTNNTEDFRANEMRYFEKYETDDLKHPASIHFTVFIHDREMQQVVANIRAGIPLSSITIHLLHKLFDEASPISYGWAPDGSMKVWKNNDNDSRAVGIKSIAFDFDVLKSLDEDDEEELKPPADFTTSFRNSEGDVLMKKVDSLSQQVTRLSSSIAFAAIFVVVFFYFAK